MRRDVDERAMSRGKYGIKDVFATLQGEGARAGAKSLFVRMAGCNLWSGDPRHRERGTGPCSLWCDTDFLSGDLYSLDDLRTRMEALWGAGDPKWCVITGGEPSLQIDHRLVDSLHDNGWKIAIETNGTIDNDAVKRCDHVCMSPKRGTSWRTLGHAHEYKVILPGAQDVANGWTEEELVEIEEFALQGSISAALFVQPQDPLVDPTLVEQTYLKRTIATDSRMYSTLSRLFDNHIKRCIDWVLAHPRWRLSGQLHKYVGLT